MAPPTDSRRSQAVVADAVERVRRLMQRAFESAADQLVLAALRRGNSRAIVLPEDDYEAFMTTLEVEEDQQAVDDLRAGIDETRQDPPPTWDELEEELGPLGKHQTDKAV